MPDTVAPTAVFVVGPAVLAAASGGRRSGGRAGEHDARHDRGEQPATADEGALHQLILRIR
jgi:hypothetical protein